MDHIINLKNSLFRRLIGVGRISLDEIFLLQKAIEEYDVREFKETKIRGLVNKMTRGGWLSEDGSVTQAGKQMWESLFNEEEELQLNKLEKVLDDFDRWWTAFPGTNSIKVDGKMVFKGDRSLRVNRDKCRVKFHQILSEGVHTADDIINALQYEIRMKIEKSLKSKENKLTYMKNSFTWLNQRDFEAFIDEAKETVVETKPARKTTNWEL